MLKLNFLLALMVMSTTVVAQEIVWPENGSANRVKELYFDGLKDKLVDNYESASIKFKRIIELDKNHDAAYFELANINFRINKLLDAETAIKRAVYLKPSNVWYLKLQSEIYKRNGNMDALQLVLDDLIKLNPEEESNYYDKASAFLIAGKEEQATNIYLQLEQKFGLTTALANAKQRVNLQKSANTDLASIEKLIADDPENIKNYLYLSGLLLDKAKKEEALTLLQKAKTIAPDNFEIDLAMADVYVSEKKNELAIVPLRSAFANTAMPVIEKINIVNGMLPRFNNQLVVKDATALVELAMQASPNDVKLIMLSGDVYYQQGNILKAKEQYSSVLKIAPDLYLAWEKLLAVQTLLGQYKEAIKTGEEALTIYPNQAILYYYTAFALHRNSQSAEAALEINTALQLLSDDDNLKAMIFALQAEVLIDQQKLKEADAAFDKAIVLAPTNYLTLSNYAYYLALRNQNLAKAEQLAAKAATALPRNSSVADTYALVLFKLNKLDDALVWIQKALKNNEVQNPVYLEHYGDILAQKGDVNNAVIQWQKSKSAGNNSEKLNKKINERKYIK